MQTYQTKIFFTTKADGNLAFHVGDAKKNVVLNHNKLADKHKYVLSKLIHMKQIHSDIVHIVNNEDNFNNPPTCDALVTDKIDTPLMVMVADCTPIILSDAKQGVIAVVHAGREGAFANILTNTLNIMRKKFNAKTQNILVNIGASICQECYEVNDDILQSCNDNKLEYSIKTINDKHYLNIKKIILYQLSKNNILEENITLNNECSSCKREKYYSFRGEGQTGRFAGVIMLY